MAHRLCILLGVFDLVPCLCKLLIQGIHLWREAHPRVTSVKHRCWSEINEAW